MPDPSIFAPIIEYYFPEPHASLLKGILFGVELETSHQFYTAIKQTGLLHIVVLSGINITLLATLIGICVKPLGRRISAGITIISIIIFVMFVGADPPVTRAAVMGILTLLAVVYEKKTIGLYILFLSAFVIAIIKAEWLTSVSFQLSFGATLGIMLWGSVQPKNVRGTLSRMLYFLENELKPTFAAQIFTTPIILWYFREFSLIAPAANLVVSAVIPPLMVFGLITVLLGYIDPMLGVIPAYVTYAFLHYIVMSIYLMSRMPHIFFTF